MQVVCWWPRGLKNCNNDKIYFCSGQKCSESIAWSSWENRKEIKNWWCWWSRNRRTERGSVSESGVSEDSEPVNSEMRDTLGCVSQKRRHLQPGRKVDSILFLKALTWTLSQLRWPAATAGFPQETYFLSVSVLKRCFISSFIQSRSYRSFTYSLGEKTNTEPKLCCFFWTNNLIISWTKKQFFFFS